LVRAVHCFAPTMKIPIPLVRYGVCVLVLCAACSSPTRLDEEDAESTAYVKRDIGQLQRIRQQPVTCSTTRDCPVGSHCDGHTKTCDWACFADSDCGEGNACTTHGACVPAPDGGNAFFQGLATNSPACAGVPPADQRTRLEQMIAADEPESCASDEGCPCGAYCDDSGACHVQCFATNPPPELTCGSGLACTPEGRCAPSASDPGPAIELTIAMSPIVAVRRTVEAPVVVPITVNVDANSLAVVKATHPATVQFQLRPTADPEADAPDNDPTPRVKCAVNDAFSETCQLTNWSFDLGAHSIHSLPRTLWIEIPQRTTARSWTLEARSQFSDTPTTLAVKSDPGTGSTNFSGHYKGTLTWPRVAGDPSPGDSVVPVEVELGDYEYAIYDASRTLLPEGHLVVPFNQQGEPERAVMMPWLTSTAGTASSNHVDVRLTPSHATYDAATGTLTATIAFHTALRDLNIVMALARTSDFDAPTCGAGASCDAGRYCQPEMQRCIPGTPVSGAVIIEADDPRASGLVLTSSQVAAWRNATIELNGDFTPVLGPFGSGLTAVQRAYCYQAPGQSTPAALAMFSALREPSLDLGCSRAGVADYAQPTFELFNRTKEVEMSGGSDAFNLLQKCNEDLAATPPVGAATPAALLTAKPCVSLARVFTALGANAGQPLQEAGQRMVTQVLRQWLGLSAFVATGTIQSRQYDDVLSTSTAPAFQRLGEAVDRVEQNLRVLLDPSIRAQYAQGPAYEAVAVQPDYRVFSRPVARWAFNDQPTVFSANSEPGPAFWVAGASALASNLQVFGSPGTIVDSNGSFAFPDRTFSFVFDAAFQNVVGGPVTIFEKGGAGESGRIWLEASTPTTPSLALELTLRDSSGASVRFAPIPWTGGGWGLLAISVDNGWYTLFNAPPFGAVTSRSAIAMTGNGPRWGAARWVGVGNIPSTCSYNTCTSYDRYTVGDNLDLSQNTFTEPAGSYQWSCTTTTHPPRTMCSGQQKPTPCLNQAAQRRNALLATPPYSTAPQWAKNALTTSGAAVNVHESPPEPPDPENGASHTTTTYDCLTTITNLPVQATRAKPVCGCAANSPPYAPGGVAYDEVQLYGRPLDLAEFTAIAARYNHTPATEALPARTTTPLPGKEQAASLAVHIVEAASAQLDLVAEYVAAERAQIYPRCVRGLASDARDRALSRAGRNVRLIGVLEEEARLLARAPGATAAPWYARYLADLTSLAAKRNKVMATLQDTATCQNPLGISEQEIPLYVGNAVGPTDKFFAGSRFLASQAQLELDRADSKLVAARDAYNNERTSQFQINLAVTDKAERTRRLRVDYEGALRRLCGTPPGDEQGQQLLLDKLLAGTLDASNCFYKTERTECQQAQTLPIQAVPASCLRGELGERVLALQAAGIEAANAKKTFDRTLAQYDEDMQYCGRRQEAFDATELILAKHHEHMQRLRASQATKNSLMGLVDGVLHVNATQFQNSFSSLAHSFGIEIGARPNELQQQREEEINTEVMNAQSHRIDIAECYHKANNEKASIDAARDVIDRALAATEGVALSLSNARDTIAGLRGEALGQFAAEATIDRTPPHLHYWLADDIDAYTRHFAYARRLTYLALRSFEHESQQLFDRRSQVLNARNPTELRAVVTEIQGRTMPFPNLPGTIDPRVTVLSLRDDILRIEDLAHNSHLEIGDPPLTPEQALQQFLVSDASKIYDANNVFRGHGIRFTVTPGDFTLTSCAERLWRILPSIQIDGGLTQTNVTITQANAFGSQACQQPFGTVLRTRVQPSQSLVVGDTPIDLGTPSAFTPMNVDAKIGMTREDLRNLPESDNAGLAGRGLYGDYILLFPSNAAGTTGFTPAVLSRIKDVLIRFDFVEETNVQL
jgi:hypothetical protein